MLDEPETAGPIEKIQEVYWRITSCKIDVSEHAGSETEWAISAQAECKQATPYQ